MTKIQLFHIVCNDLDLIAVDTGREMLINHYIDTAIALITREGATLASGTDADPFTVEDADLIRMYTAYLYRKRASGEAMPAMLRYALNNRIFSEKAGNNGV